MNQNELIDELILVAVGAGPVQTDLVYDLVNKIVDPELVYERLARLKRAGLVDGVESTEGPGRVFLTNKGKARRRVPWNTVFNDPVAAREVQDAEDMEEFKRRAGRA